MRSSQWACWTPDVLRCSRISEVVLTVVAGLGLGEMVDEVVILVDAEGPVGRQGLHRERAGDTDHAWILEGLVVRVLNVRLSVS